MTRKKHSQVTSASKAKFNLKIKKASNSEDLEDEEEALEEMDEETVACEKRSHHLTVKCRILGCGLKVKDMKRHLKTHVTKKQLDETCSKGHCYFKGREESQGATTDHH